MTAPKLASANNMMGIFEDLGDVYDQPDLDLFFTTFAPYVVGPPSLCDPNKIVTETSQQAHIPSSRL